MLGNLNGRIDGLNDALAAGPVTLDSLPDDARDRWLSGGVYKLQLQPKEDLNDNLAIARFVRQLQAKDAAVNRPARYPGRGRRGRDRGVYLRVQLRPDRDHAIAAAVGPGQAGRRVDTADRPDRRALYRRPYPAV